MFGEYPSSRTARCTALRVVLLTYSLPLTTRETVIGDTPACRATSLIVTPARSRLLRVVLRAGLLIGLGIPGRSAAAPALRTRSAAHRALATRTWIGC